VLSSHHHGKLKEDRVDWWFFSIVRHCTEGTKIGNMESLWLANSHSGPLLVKFTSLFGRWCAATIIIALSIGTNYILAAYQTERLFRV
jgi:hypothetical protein